MHNSASSTSTKPLAAAATEKNHLRHNHSRQSRSSTSISIQISTSPNENQASNKLQVETPSTRHPRLLQKENVAPQPRSHLKCTIPDSFTHGKFRPAREGSRHAASPSQIARIRLAPCNLLATAFPAPQPLQSLP